VRVVELEDDDGEADRVASEIVGQHARRRCSWGEFAVVYRSNHQARALELRLQAMKVPYRISGGGSFFDRGEIRDALAYYRLLVNPDDDGALLRVINVPRRQLGAATLSALQQVANRRRSALLPAIDASDLAVEVGGSAARRLIAFRDWLSHWRGQLRRPAAALRDLLTDAHYENWLASLSKDDAELARIRWSNIELLLAAIERRSLAGDDPAEILRSLALDSALDQDEDDEQDPEEVQLLTLHAAKGLEFAHVWLMGFEEGLLPHRNCVTDEQVAEERRLAYVGLTRAMETLTLTMARKRRARGESRRTEPSRFLTELPKEHIEWEGQEDEPEARKEARARESLDALKNLLA